MNNHHAPTALDTPPPLAGTREWIGMAVLVLPALLVSMDLSVLFMAAPWISAELAPTATQQLWVMDIYGFVMAGLLITMGSIGDRVGRRRMLLIGAIAFGAASLVAAYSTSAEMLIAARALLGVGAATLAPSTLSLIRGMFLDEAQRRTAIGIWTAAFTSGFAIGPVIGGLLLEHFHWGSVFLINVPVMVLLLATAPLIIRESRDPAAASFDLWGSLLSLAAVLSVIYGVKKMTEHGLEGRYLGILVAGVALMAVFLRQQRAASEPMIDVRLFARAAFSASILANMTVVFATAGMGLLAVTYIQTVLGYAPFDAALWMLPAVGGSIAGVTVVSLLAQTVRPSVLVAAGLTVSASGFFWVSTIGPESDISMLIAGYALLTVGVGMTATLATSLVLTTAPPEKAGAASGISETSSEFGGALGIATLGTLAAAVYRDHMEGRIPESVDDEAAASAEDAIGGAVSVAEQSSGDVAGRILSDAFEAYSNGFSVAAIVGGLLVVAVGIVAGTALRRVTVQQVSAAGETSSQPEPARSGQPVPDRRDP